MVVHQPVKGVHAARATGVDERQPGRSGEGEAVAISGDIGDVISYETVGARQYLSLFAGIVEANHPVGRRDVTAPSLRIHKDPIDAEYVLIFKMHRMDIVGSKNVHATVEVPNPQAAAFVGSQRGNIAVAQDRGSGRKHLLPAK